MKIRQAALILGGCLLLASPALAAATPELQVVPEQVEIGAFFQGGQVTVTGKIPRGAQAVLEVVGQIKPEHLMRKGRRGGLWMNVGEVEVQGAPSLYLAMSTDPRLLQGPPVPGATWGYPALKQRLSLTGVGKGEQEFFLEQFFQLMESEATYAAFPGAAKVSGAAGDLQIVTGTFPLPTKVKPGTYQVCLTVIQDGQVTARNCVDLKVRLMGFPAMLSSLAYQHGATYGILAVIIAIVVGFAMGYLFKGGGGH
jgi:hypothetical protein